MDFDTGGLIAWYIGNDMFSGSVKRLGSVTLRCSLVTRFISYLSFTCDNLRQIQVYSSA